MNASAILSVALIGNGELGSPEIMREQIKKSEKVIAIDGGLRYCEVMGIRPDLIVGDFDSVEPSLLLKYKDVYQCVFPRDKDFTDLELGITKAEEFNPTNIILFGALGGRPDHALYNLNLLGRMPGKLRIETESETLYAITDQVVIDCFPGQTLSLMPIGDSAEGVTSKGLKWELNQATLNTYFMSLSNVALQEKITVNIQNGVLLVVLVKRR